MSWSPLTVHSQYSILQSTIDLDRLCERGKEYGYEAIGVTDNGNLYGAVDFYKAARKVGIKPVIGAKFYLSHRDRTHKKREAQYPNSSHLFLLAKDAQGYQNLCKLSSRAFLEGFYYVPRIDFDLLRDCSQGLICLCGTLGSVLSFAALEREELLKPYLDRLQEYFGDNLFLQIENYEMEEEERYEQGIEAESWLSERYHREQEQRAQLAKLWMRVSKEYSIGLLATHESFYLDQAQWRAQEVLMNVQSGETLELWQSDPHGGADFKKKNPKRDVLASHAHDFKAPSEIAKRFAFAPKEALTSAAQIVERCAFDFDFQAKHYPGFEVPREVLDQSESSQNNAVGSYLKEQTHAAIVHRYGERELEAIAKVYPGQDPGSLIRDRLENELQVILSKGLADYLLIVADFIQWAKEQKIPVGPGRGSGAGSIICYLLGITDIEPLRFHLFFERFINPERASYPDIDVDICMERRSEVIEYMLKKYGRDNVAQIITFGTMKAKMSIKDVGRVLSVPLAKVNALAKLFPDDLHLTLRQALEDPEVRTLHDADPATKELFDMAQVLEGCVRNTGIHAAGLIISAQPLEQHIPLCVSKDAQMPVTQFSMKPAESIGMLKIDFLGLKTLTSIQYCVDHLGSRADFDWMHLPLDDASTFALLNKGRTMGVFQLESAGMQDLARGLHLDRFEEIIAIVSLYRPGPMDMIPSFVARKHGREPIEYDHPWLKEILSETYGIMVYQEQVMQIASKMAAFSLAEGDVLRRAMGKKDAQEMSRQREKFVQGAQERGVKSEVATKVFDKMEKFAAYGFNKSHAAAYGYIAYVTAFLKANYPREWLAALMTCDRDDLTKVSKFIAEARSMEIEILPPDVNSSGEHFTAIDEGIRFALGAVKGVGRGIAQEIVIERSKRGPFEGLYDFIERMQGKKITKKVIESLVDAGGFDFTTWSRDALLASVEPMSASAAQKSSEQAKGFMNLFEDLHAQEKPFLSPPKVPSPRESAVIYLREKELLGFYLTGNPLQSYGQQIALCHCSSLESIEMIQGDGALRIAFIIDEIAVKMSQRTQKKFAILKISDGASRYELPIWPEIYDQYGADLKENAIFLAVIAVENKSGLKLSCRWLCPIENWSRVTSREIDDAFDKTKEFLSWSKKPRKKQSLQGGASQGVAQEKVMQFIVQAQKLQLSQILDLSALLRRHPGRDLVHLELHGGPRLRYRLSFRADLNVKNLTSKLDTLI